MLKLTETLTTSYFNPLMFQIKTLKLSERTWFVQSHTGKERTTDMCNNVNDSQKHYVAQKKPEREESILFYCIK